LTRSRFLIAFAAAVACSIAPPAGHALGRQSYVSNTPALGSFALVENHSAVPLLVSDADWPGVVRAAQDLRSDVDRVSGVQPDVKRTSSDLAGGVAIIIGTIGKSALIDDLVRHHKLDVSDIAGKWESAVTAIVDRPMPGVRRALVIAGSDKRGTIFAIYDLSEQIGVSPWYWWADVRIPHRDALFVAPGRHIQPVPAVKYRGIFLNDEAPALTGWCVRTKPDAFSGCDSRLGKGKEPPHRESSLGLMEVTR
jgi:hypothetical protein